MHRVLLVSHSQETKQLVKKFLKNLKNQKIQLEEADCGDQAISLISGQEKNYHLILLEVNMPEKDGFKVCLELRAMEKVKEIPLIFLSESQSSTSTDKFVAYAIGADDFLIRPWRKEEFCQKIQSKLGLS